jgi:hypothetical protein
MFDVIRLTNEINFYRQEILTALRDSGHNADADQLFDFARLFAQNGDADARRAIYEKFRLNCANGIDTGARTLIELDKSEGLIFVADTLGETLALDGESWIDYLLSVADDAGVATPWDLLQEAATVHAGVRAYLAQAVDNRTRRAACARPTPQPGFQPSAPWAPVCSWGSYANP